MAFIPHTDQDVTEMLATIGVNSEDELFADLPEQVRLNEPPGPARPLSEYETLRLMGDRAALNRAAVSSYSSFMGAGAYEHFIPAAVPALAQRGELLTAYTPYQAEASQGTLQIMYEFQSMICALTGMGVANASMYDGASALAEAVLMAVRLTGKRQIVLPATLHPAYREVVLSYTRNLDIELLTWGELGGANHGERGQKEGELGGPGGVTDPSAWPPEATDAAAAVIAQPNFWGFLEQAGALAEAARENGALTIAVVNPMSLSVLDPPGSWGADIAVGECQPLGLPLNFGGPYAGFMATRKKYIRKMPGRIVGRSKDAQGRDAFVLTLQTREQHIRRESATSNICTNQGLCATMVTLYLSMIGKGGLECLGDLNLHGAGRLYEGMKRLPGVEPLCDAPFFNEFTITLPIDAEKFFSLMREQGILPGLPASRLGPMDARRLIVCATETKLGDDIDRYLETAEKVLAQ